MSAKIGLTHFDGIDVFSMTDVGNVSHNSEISGNALNKPVIALPSAVRS